jgi:hypothetical protein
MFPLGFIWAERVDLSACTGVRTCRVSGRAVGRTCDFCARFDGLVIIFAKSGGLGRISRSSDVDGPLPLGPHPRRGDNGARADGPRGTRGMGKPSVRGTCAPVRDVDSEPEAFTVGRWC